MKKLFSTILMVCILLLSTSCQNIAQPPKKLVVKEIETHNAKQWDIKVTPRLDHKRWVYDADIQYRGESPVDATILLYDHTTVRIEKLEPFAVQSYTGSYDYKDSVYSKKNSNLKFKLTWVENGKAFEGDAEYRIYPK